MKIVDPIIHPYIITVDQDQYTVIKTAVSEKTGKDTEKVVGYCVNIQSAIELIVRQEMSSEGTMTLKSYLKEYNNKRKEIINKITL